MVRIRKVTPGVDYFISVYFDNTHSVTINMQEKLHTVRFSELRNVNVFNSAKTDGRSIMWPGGVSIAISEIIDIITKNR